MSVLFLNLSEGGEELHPSDYPGELMKFGPRDIYLV